jgi:hypothetical protein
MKTSEFASGNVDTVLFTLLSTLRSIYLWVPKKSSADLQLLKIELPRLLLYGIREV